MTAHIPVLVPQLLPFATFAFVASITPGPSNLLVLGNSARHGFRAELPVVWGSCGGGGGHRPRRRLRDRRMAGATSGHPDGDELGGSHLDEHPGVAWRGVAWRIASHCGGTVHPTAAKPTGGMTAAALQIVNPKAWGMALAVVGVFAGETPDLARYALLSAVFLTVSMPYLATWAVLGARAATGLRLGMAMRAFNLVLGAALLASAWFGVCKGA